jgi:hypothetical protein
VPEVLDVLDVAAAAAAFEVAVPAGHVGAPPSSAWAGSAAIAAANAIALETMRRFMSSPDVLD